MEPVAKLFCGIIIAQDCELSAVIEVLENKFGPIDLESDVISFNFTDYYEKELGSSLKRCWVSFTNPILQSDLCKMKQMTIEIEKKFARSNGTRRVNLDSGYVNLSRLVLATTKDYSHRMYLGDGIYGEVTLIYKDNQFQPLEWTYPDYRENGQFFEAVRNGFRNKMPKSE